MSFGSFILIIVLTNILDKKDFGLFAIVNIVMVFSSEFIDMGISQAIIQKQKINRKQLSTLYWLNILLASLIFTIINLSSNAIGVFYKENELPKLILIVSFCFLFSGTSSVYHALLQKNLKFKLMSIIEIIAFSSYVLVTLYLAYIGFGVYSLVWGTLTKTIIKSILLIITGLKLYMPIIYFNLKEIKDFLNFGGFRTGAFLISFLNRQLDSILIGKVIGMQELGVYDVFKRVVMQPARFLAPIVNKVVYPLLSKVNTDMQRISEMFIKVLNLLNIVRFPIYLVIVLLAPEVVDLFFGEDWKQHVVVLQILAFVFLFKTIQSFVGTAILSSGKANWSLYNNLILLPLNLFAVFIGSRWGIFGISISLLILAVLIIYPRYKFLIKPLYKLSFKKYFELVFLKLIPLLIVLLIINFICRVVNENIIITLALKLTLFLASIFINIKLFEMNSINYLRKSFLNGK